MLNVGRRCELSCSHCHHRCSPEAPEAMTHEVLEASLALADRLHPALVDVTGGSPELWPLLPELVKAARATALPLRVRTNLMSLADPENIELAESLASCDVTILASLPGTSDESVGAVRGRGVFERSLRALELLSSVGYGQDGGPVIELAWNPRGGLPRSESELEEEMAAFLGPLGVRVDRVRAIANVPLGRHGDMLRQADSLVPYLHELAEAFDARALPSLPCREGLTISWDGMLCDCDFNLAADMPLADGPLTVFDALSEPDALHDRRIAFASHCFACTVGGGSG
jgi:radical SAM/Cys-rich protein